MNKLKKTYRFLGSIYFAIILISLTALMVVIGTVIESLTDSHLLAARWTYHHPFFAILLWLFFINILFSALQRWPFKWRHTAFLITHFGLLMIIGGTILKNKIGLQGNLSILEGSTSQQVHLPYTHALSIETPTQRANLPVITDSISKTHHSPTFPDLSVKVLAFYPHVKEKIETWIKKEWVSVKGQQNLPLVDWKKGEPIPTTTQMTFDGYPSPWDVAAVKTAHLSELIYETYLHNLKLKLKSRNSSKQFSYISLKEAIDRPLVFDKGELKLDLSLPYLSHESFVSPQLIALWDSKNKSELEQVTINLQGPQALINLIDDDHYYGFNRFELDLIRTNPQLLFAQDEQENTHLIFFDTYGRVHAELFPATKLETLFAYNGGYGGYAVQAQLPFPTFPTSREDKEHAMEKVLQEEMKQAIECVDSLAPPLELFRQACEKTEVDFVKTFIIYLAEWRESGQLLLEKSDTHPQLKEVVKNIEWKNESGDNKKACQWICLLFDRLEQPLSCGENIQTLLNANHWPLTIETEQSKPADCLVQLAQQVFAIADQLPPAPTHLTSLADKTRLLSAFFKAYEIDPRILSTHTKQKLASSNNEFEVFAQFKEWNPTFIETPLSTLFLRSKPPVKLEDQQPCIVIELRQGAQKERIALAYNSVGLKWPVLNGNYKIRYQTQSIEIPYKIRLRQAREICYPETQQPYSYESDILITHGNALPSSKTLSMNAVHETWEGYRFYLSGMNTISSQGLKSVQIVVNHDPAKYLLTYPGSIIVFIGIILLFWFKR